MITTDYTDFDDCNGYGTIVDCDDFILPKASTTSSKEWEFSCLEFVVTSTFHVERKGVSGKSDMVREWLMGKMMTRPSFPPVAFGNSVVALYLLPLQR